VAEVGLAAMVRVVVLAPLARVPVWVQVTTVVPLLPAALVQLQLVPPAETSFRPDARVSTTVIGPDSASGPLLVTVML
jgi:hypothetical protein